MKHNFLFLTIFLLINVISSNAQEQAPKGFKTYHTDYNLEKNMTFRINNSNRNLEIKFWDKNILRLENTLPDSLSTIINENDWQEKLGIKVDKFMSRTEITILGSKLSGAKPYKDRGNLNSRGAIEKLMVNEEAIQTQTDQVLTLKPGVPVSGLIITTVLYIPALSHVDLVNKYSSVSINGNISKGYFNLENTVLDAGNFKSLRLISKYSTVNIEAADDCEADISGSTFRAGAIDKLEIESTRSTVELQNTNTIYVRSNLDNGYTIEEVSVAEGRLLYSNIRIEKLIKKLDFDGNNYDVKLRLISPSVEIVKINNSFADIRFPVKGLTSYVVNFDGKYSSVFAPFEIVSLQKEDTQKTIGSLALGPTPYTNTFQTPNAPRFFKTTVGNTETPQTSFEITCHRCTVDFK
jgi:hypothetical protein